MRSRNSKLMNETALIEEIKNGKYRIFLQPKFDMKSHITGAEALIRYQNKKEQIEKVDNLLFLEDEALIYHIDLFVFEEICKLQKKWNDLNIPPVRVSVNFSRCTLELPYLLERMNQICLRYGTKSSYIEVEITETRETVDLGLEVKIIKEIVKAGYGIALDDYGIGYSNLLYLIKNPFHTLKLDKSLIDEIEDSWKDRMMLENLIKTCHSLKIKVVAEGVENKTQLDFLIRVNCDYIQGYIHDQPLEVEIFERKYLYPNGL